MYDYAKAGAAVKRFHEDFMPDFQADAAPPARVFDLLGLNLVDWPGHGVADDSPWQYREGEYMKADEYDALAADPSDYFRRSYLPRIGSSFAPLAALDPFSDMMEAIGLPFNILPFADPAVVEGVKRIAEAANETIAYLEIMDRVAADAAGRLGIPALESGILKAPYDVIADTLRGTKGIVMDRFRQPQKIIEAAERMAPLQVSMGVRQTAVADSPLTLMPLHKGADGFMSDADFRTFYWPTLQTVLKGLVYEGIVPVLFAEGSYNKRLRVIADDGLPDGSVIWLFDQVDMFEAKRTLGGHACIMGNVPNSLLALGTGEEVAQYVTRLLDGCATDGGFILGSGAVVDDAKPETLRAMIETGRSWVG
jgi:hypothetical protein